MLNIQGEFLRKVNEDYLSQGVVIATEACTCILRDISDLTVVIKKAIEKSEKELEAAAKEAAVKEAAVKEAAVKESEKEGVLDFKVS